MTGRIATDPELEQDARARQLVAAVNDKLDGLQDIVARTADLLSAWRQSGGGQAGGQARDAALGNLDQLQGGAEAVRQGIMLLLEDARGEGVPTPGAADQQALDLRRREAWHVARRALDRAGDEDAVTRAIEELATMSARSADTATLDALREQLPGYLTERGMVEPAATAVGRVDAIEAPHLPPLMRAGTLARAALSTAWPRVVSAFELVRAEISGTGARVESLPGVDEGQPVLVR